MKGIEPVQGGRPLARRRIAWWLLVLLLTPLVWFGLDLAYVAVGAESDKAAKADVILVLGCNPIGASGPSPCMMARAGHAADLYEQGYSAHLIATGNPEEVSVIRFVLESEGVPPEVVVPEPRSYNTIQNIVNSGEIIRERGWQSAIIVTEPFHIKRSELIARDIWGNAVAVYPSPAVDSQNWDSLPARAYHLSRDALSLMLYQMKALVGIRD